MCHDERTLPGPLTPVWVEPACARRNSSGGLAELERPRKHYVWYYSTPEANDDMRELSAGDKGFPALPYFHVKSGEWSGQWAVPAASHDESRRTGEFADLLLMMDRDVDMAATVAPFIRRRANRSPRRQWMTESDLDFYATEFGRTGFQGGLNWYRCGTVPGVAAWKWSYSDGRKARRAVNVHWGRARLGYPPELPGALNAMETAVLLIIEERFLFPVLVRRWVQQGSARIKSYSAAFGIHERAEFGIKPFAKFDDRFARFLGPKCRLVGPDAVGEVRGLGRQEADLTRPAGIGGAALGCGSRMTRAGHSDCQGGSGLACGKVESSSEGRGAFHGQAAATVGERNLRPKPFGWIEVSGRTQGEIARDLGVGAFDAAALARQAP